MKIYSRLITREIVGQTVTTTPGVTFQNTFSRDGWFEPIREFSPRDGGNGFEIHLAGTSPYRAGHDSSEYAATWTEWGIVIDKLYAIDPNAKIGNYNSKADFERKTREALDCNVRYERVGGHKKPGMTAPWLPPNVWPHTPRKGEVSYVIG